MLDSSFMIIKFYDMKYYRILGLPPREKKMKFSLFLNEIFIQNSSAFVQNTRSNSEKGLFSFIGKRVYVTYKVLLKNYRNETFFQVEMEDICYCIKEDNDNLNVSTKDCAQQLQFYCGYNG